MNNKNTRANIGGRFSAAESACKQNTRVVGALSTGANLLERSWSPILGGLAALLVINCSGESSTSTGTGGASSGGSANSGGSPISGGRSNSGGSETAGGSAGAAGGPGSATESPRSIYELLDLINGLPHPVQLEDVIERLERPLALHSTSNVQSAQPALGKRSPRIFMILTESFSLSVVPGAEEPLLEFGERDATGLVSVKGELHFPIEDQLTPVDAFSRLSPDAGTGLTLDDATSCGVCHDKEKPSLDYPYRGAFASAIVRPQPFFSVDAEAIRKEWEACDSQEEPERCSLLDALFSHGDVLQTAFP